MGDASEGASTPGEVQAAAAGSRPEAPAAKPPPGPVTGAIERLRAFAAAVQRALALGTLAMLLGALLNLGLALGVLAPLLEGGPHIEAGVAADLLSALADGFGLLVSLPLLAWLVAWIFDDRPYRLCIGAALFALAWMLFVRYLSVGAEGLLARPVHLAAFVATGLLAGVAGAAAFRKGRSMAERRERRRRRVAPEVASPPAVRFSGVPSTAGLTEPGAEARDEEVEALPAPGQVESALPAEAAPADAADAPAAEDPAKASGEEAAEDPTVPSAKARGEA